MNSDAKIEKLKVNFKNINLNQGINNSPFSSTSNNNIQTINPNIVTIDYSNISSVNANSIDTSHTETKSVFEKTGATGVEVITSLVEGLGLFGEAIVDAGAILGTAINSVTTGIIDGGQALFDISKGTIKSIKNNDNVFDSIKNEFDNYQSLTVSNWENTRSFVSNEYVKTAFDGFYGNNSVGKWINDTSYGFNNVRNVGSGVGYVGGIVAISIATFGVGGAAIGGSAAATSATTSGLSATMAGVAGVAGLGKGTQNAWNDGASLGKGLAYGTASAAWEGAQFYAGGQINALNVGSNALGNAGVRVGLDTLTGASEGFVQPALQKIYKDESYSELFNQAGGWQNVGIQAGMSAGMSALGEASGLAKKFRETPVEEIDNTLLQKYSEIKDKIHIDDINSTASRKQLGEELYSSIGYDKTPTLVSSESFENMASQSQYGKIYRGITGENAIQYAEQFKNGKMYVGGGRASIIGTGIYAGYGDEALNIGNKYSVSPTANSTDSASGVVLEMILSDDAKVIDYSTIAQKQSDYISSVVKKFQKYDKGIIDEISLKQNLSKITNATDFEEAKYIANVLNDTGYFAALNGYDAITDSSKGYMVILNRGKVIMKDTTINNNDLLDVKNLPLS